MDEPLAALDEARKAEILPYFERLRDETRRADPLRQPLRWPRSRGSPPRSSRCETGRVVRAGPGGRGAGRPRRGRRRSACARPGRVLTGRVAAHHADGLTELRSPAGRLFLPRVAAPAGAAVRVRIAAQDVILSREPPAGLSALNILPGTVARCGRGEGPGRGGAASRGRGLLLARITRRSADALGLAPGVDCHVIMKSVSVAQGDVGLVGPSGPDDPAG